VAVSLLALALGPAASLAAAGCRLASGATAERAAPGPFAVGTMTATFVDAERATPPNGAFPGAPTRTLMTEIWYPAGLAGRDVALDARGAPYPLVLHAHALLDSRTGESYLAAHLASHGYVVAAVDFPLSQFGAPGGATVRDLPNQPGDLRVVLDGLLALSAAGGGVLAGAIDPSRVGASGLSLGATTVLLAAYHSTLRDPRIRAVLPIAPPYSCALTRRFFRGVRLPLLVLQGDDDLLVALGPNSERLFRRARGPRYLVVLRHGSHLGFVGFAEALDQSEHFDRFGCTALGAVLGTDVSLLPLPGDRREGISRDATACPSPCQRQPADPALPAARQHEIARTVAVAFFDAYLEKNRAAGCILRRGLMQEYAEVRTSVRRDGAVARPRSPGYRAR
jgi:predicted dienelactone hydrolase